MLKYSQPRMMGEFIMQTIIKGSYNSHTNIRTKYQTKIMSRYFSPGLIGDSNIMWDKFTLKDYLKLTCNPGICLCLCGRIPISKREWCFYTKSPNCLCIFRAQCKASQG